MKIMDELDSATENELEMFSKINHENIVRYFDHFHLNIGDDNHTFLITEYCEVIKISLILKDKLVFLKVAFPSGQFGDPPIPSNLPRSSLFSTILSKYFFIYCFYKFG